MAPVEKATKSYGSIGRVVVIGGNGFVGHHIVGQALSSSWSASSVASIDLRCDRNRNPDAAYYECDITDQARLQTLMEDLKPDVVIHTASPAADTLRPNNELYRRVNVEGTKAVIAACQNASVKALVYTSSASVITRQKDDVLNGDERWPVIVGKDQPDYYTESKATAEGLVLEANRKEPYQLLTSAIRPAGIFGEGDVQLLPGIINAYQNGLSDVQIGRNTNIWDFTYVGNVAHAHLLAAKLLLATAAAPTKPLDLEKTNGEAYFISNDSPVYFWDFFMAVWCAVGKTNGRKGRWVIPKDVGWLLACGSEFASFFTRKDPSFTRFRVSFVTMTRYFNINKAKSTLGYEPVWSLQEGIDRGVAWFLENQKTTAVKAQ